MAWYSCILQIGYIILQLMHMRMAASFVGKTHFFTKTAAGTFMLSTDGTISHLPCCTCSIMSIGHLKCSTVTIMLIEHLPGYAVTIMALGHLKCYTVTIKLIRNLRCY